VLLHTGWSRRTGAKDFLHPDTEDVALLDTAPLKIVNGSGSPLRVLALVEDVQ
jgi:hypothetical protein